MLHKLIELVHVYVHQKLTCEVAEWKSFSRAGALETFRDPFQKPKRIGIGDVFLHDLDEDCLIDRSEELCDVAFQHPARSSIIQ